MSYSEKVENAAISMWKLLKDSGITKNEAVLAISLLLEILARPAQKSEVTAPPEPPKQKKSVSYDPVYDPKPPFEVEAPPPRAEAPMKLADANTACICDACHKVIYVTNKEVMNFMKVQDFIDAYTPTPGHFTIPKTTEIENIDGKITCDCPDCGAKKKLYLTGGPAL